MKSILKPALCAAALLLSAANASANVVQLKWVTTVSEVSGSLPGIVGETLTTIISVDNGGSSLTSQTWSSANFLSFREEGASGWFIESTDLGSDLSGSFKTNAVGKLVNVASWVGKYFNGGTVNTSWEGTTAGGWWDNGKNETACTTTDACVNAANVKDNQKASSWTVSFAPPVVAVPEPGVFALMGIGLLGLAISRKRSA